MATGPAVREHAAITHQGLVREANQDRFLVGPLPGQGLLLAVADGLGGQAAGEEAAQEVVDTLDGDWGAPQDDEAGLAEAALLADRRIRTKAAGDPAREGMGSTLVAALIRGGWAHWVNVGDSRLYLFRNGSLRQLSTDQNLVQILVEDRTLDKVEARRHPLAGILDQCLGCGSVEPETGRLPLMAGDVLLLCSDGLYADLNPGIKTGILLSSQPLAEQLRRMVAAALAAGGRDNITAVAARL